MGTTTAHVADDRLEDHGGDLACRGRQTPLPARPDRCIRSTSVSRAAPRVTPGEFGDAQRRGGTAGGHQQAIDVPVIVARELDDHFAAGESAGESDGAHRRLGAGIDQPHVLDRRDGRDDQFGQFAFGLGRGAEACAAGDRRFEGRDDGRMGVAENHRSPGADVVDVAVAIDIEQIGPRPALEKQRLAADAAERPGRAIHAAGHELLGAGKGEMAEIMEHNRDVFQKSS